MLLYSNQFSFKVKEKKTLFLNTVLKLGKNTVPNHKQNENKGHHDSKNFCHIIQAVNTLPLPIESNWTIF